MNYRSRYYDDSQAVQFFHAICKIPDRPEVKSYPLKPHHKKHFIEMLTKLLKCFEVKCISCSIMGTHAHLCLARFGKVKSTMKQAAERYEKYYGKQLDARSLKCARFRSKLNNISEFMKILQERFTRWYNGTFEPRRRGSLWNPRFKSVLVTGSHALKNLIIYIELNCVRAKMHGHPSDYRYCTFGMKKRNHGHHPFQKDLCTLFRKFMGDEWKNKTDGYVIAYFEKEIIRIIAGEVGLRGEQLDNAVRPYEQKMLMQCHKFWSCGGVIGDTPDQIEDLRPPKRRPTELGTEDEPPNLY